MRSLIATTLTAVAMLLTACDRNTLGLSATGAESFEEFVNGLEKDAREGVPTDWTNAEEQFAAYTASLPSASAGLTEAEKLKQDELIGRWWAVRVRSMSIGEACDYLQRQGRRAESFLEEVQR